MRRNLAYSAALLILLAGCAQFGGGGDYWLKPGQAQPGSRAAALLLYADYVRGLPAADYARELEQVRKLAAREKSDYRQLQYALALSMPGGDARKAQQAIEAVARGHGKPEPELDALANLIGAELAERRRLETRIDAGSKRADELERKLEAVKNIEKNLMNRDKGSAENP